ncbi:MAG: acyl-CoA dehydratase activase-related protein, partial [Planctomycetota bacterium]
SADEPFADAASTRRPARQPLFLGLDVGSVSTNIVLADAQGRVEDELYLYTEGDPVAAVRYGLGALGDSFPEPPPVAAVGVTGSGRHLIGDFVGADTVVNEITAQARAAKAIDPAVDTVFEIGGQDSKFIRLREGAVADFEMNKVCAAGTGAFLAEQATRLDIEVDRDFSRLALEAEAPVDLGSRCTVFMESDLIHHQQQGAAKADLVAGLAYAIARNYLEKVVGHKPIGDRILFQGGLASNPSVVAAFENLLERPVTVPPWNRATGALGAALLARDAAKADQPSRFHGFDLSDRTYRTESFTCSGCPNRCEIKKVVLDGEAVSHYGSICGRYDARAEEAHGPDLFAERQAMLLDGWLPEGPAPDAPTIGIPRVLLFHELFPEWCAFFQSLGYRVVLSDPTNRRIIHQGLEHVVVETCFPIKVTYGHIVDLLEKGVERVFVPAVVEVPQAGEDRKRYLCPCLQSVASFLRSAFPDVEILSPVLTSAGRRSNWRTAMTELAQALGHGPRAVDGALSAARSAQRRFERRRVQRGRETLDGLSADAPGVVLLGRPYNTADQALSMQLARKLRQRGVVPIPMDLLPLGEVELDAAWDDVVWKMGREFLAAARVVRETAHLHPVLVSSFGCGPDAFLVNTLEEVFADRPFLVLELDEHFADAGLITRCEAYLHEIRTARQAPAPSPPAPRPVHVLNRRCRHMDRTVYIPSASEDYYAIWGALQAMGLRTQAVPGPVWGRRSGSGLRAQMLPRPDRHSEEMGRRHTLSRGCLPFIHFAGDAVRMTQLDDFEPSRSAFAIPGNDESCRVSYFPRGIRQILDRIGARETVIVSPRVSMETDESLRVFGAAFERHFWQALLAIEVLFRKRLETRPYELTPGDTDAVFDRHILRVPQAVGRADFLDTVIAALRAMDSVPTAPRGTRPRIGLVGDRYVLTNDFANSRLLHEIERLGGDVALPPYFIDYLRIQGRRYPRPLQRMGRHGAALVAAVRQVVQQRDYDHLERLFAPFLRHGTE